MRKTKNVLVANEVVGGSSKCEERRSRRSVLIKYDGWEKEEKEEKL